MLRLLANENIPRIAIHVLRSAGHDVTWMAELGAGASDIEVATRAQQEDRILLTFDKEFGELILRRGVSQPRGLILCRFRTQSPTTVAKFLQEVLSQPHGWDGHFTVIEETEVRMVRLP